MQRWQKRHGKAKDVVLPFSSDPSLVVSSSRILDNMNEPELPMETDCDALGSPTDTAEPTERTEDSRSGAYGHWSLVDVPGSPLLTRLFEALEIECESLIPSLDLDSSNPAVTLMSTLEKKSDVEASNYNDHEDWFNFSIGIGSKDLVRYSQEVFQGSDMIPTGSDPRVTELSFSEWCYREWDFSRGQPPKININHILGLSPFPASSPTSRNRASGQGYLSAYARLLALKDKEIDYKGKLHKLKRALGAGNPKTLIFTKELAYIYLEQEKYKQAEQLYRQIAISYQRVFGLKHVQTLSAYLDVVDLLRSRGKALQAQKIHQGIHDIIISLFDPDDHLVLHTNSIRTTLLYRSGQIDAAEKLMRQTFHIGLYTFGPWNRDNLYYMKVLARALALGGKLVESEHLLRINMNLYREVEGPFSEDFLDSMQRLACVSIRQGRFDEGKSLAMSAAEHMGASIGQEHYDTLYNFYVAAVCTKRQGDLPDSERQLRLLLERQVRRFGENQKSVYMCMEELSTVLTDMGRHAEATTLMEKCHEGWAELYGVGHRATLLTCLYLVDNYQKLDRSEDAVTLLRRNINDARNLGEKDIKILLRAVSKLTRLLVEAGRYKEASKYYEEFLSVFAEFYGLSHAQTFHSVDGLGYCYEKLERYAEALALYQRTFYQISNVSGYEHPTLINLSSWMIKIQEILAARTEQVDGEKEDANLCESMLVEEPPTNAEGMNMHGNTAAEERVTPAEERWMGALFDFDLLEIQPSNIVDPDGNCHADET